MERIKQGITLLLIERIYYFYTCIFIMHKYYNILCNNFAVIMNEGGKIHITKLRIFQNRKKNENYIFPF